MQSGHSTVDDVWDRVRQRLTSPNILAIREIRRLLDLPRPEARAAIAPLLASDDVERLRLNFTLLANVSRYLLARDMNPSGLTFARQQTATLLANKLGDRIKALGHPTSTATTSAHVAKRAAYVALVHRLLRLADWTESSQAEAEQIITKLEETLASDPPGFLASELKEAVAITWAGIGDHLADTSTLAVATGAYRRAIETFEAAGQAVEARKVRLNLVGLIRRFVVDFDETITQIAAMLEEMEAEGPSLQRAQVHLELAETYVSVGDHDAARAQIQAAEQDSWRCGWPAPDLADIDSSFGRWVAHAEEQCNTSDEFSEALVTELTVEETALALRARVALNASERDACSRAKQQVAALKNRLNDEGVNLINSGAAEQTAFTAEFGHVQTFATLPTSTALGRLRVLHAALGAALDELDDRRKAGAFGDGLLPEVESIIREARSHRLAGIEASALLLCADIHDEAGRFEAATEAARAAFDLPRDPESDLTTGLRALDRLISTGIALNDRAAISAACGKAIELIERHRYNISAPYAQSAFLRRRVRYYTIGMDTALTCGDLDLFVQRADAFKAAGSLRNVAAPPNFSAGELESRFRDLTGQIEQARQAGDAGIAEALAEKRRAVWDLLAIARARAHHVATPPPVTLAALQAVLEPDEALVSWYWLTPELLMTFAIDNRQHCVAKYRIEEAERSALNEFADAVQSLKHAAGWIDQVRRFSATLLPEKIHLVLKGKRRLILSPHRMLHALPLHALAWDGDLLLRRFAVSYAPNLSCLTRQHHASRERGVLAVGISDFAIPGEKLKPLPDCVPEAKAVAAAWTASGIPTIKLLNEQAITLGVRTLAAGGELARLSCLHFATHGADVLGDNPMEAHLWLHDGRLDGLEIAMWQLEADLVVLSACHSGQRAIERHGTELIGDDIFGLQAAFFTAGAARVLGALWPADSPTAATLMADFHRRYAAGDRPEVALQAAMLDCLDNATPLTRAAYYWAPFYIAAVTRPTPQILEPRST